MVALNSLRMYKLRLHFIYTKYRYFVVDKAILDLNFLSSLDGQDSWFSPSRPGFGSRLGDTDCKTRFAATGLRSLVAPFLPLCAQFWGFWCLYYAAQLAAGHRASARLARGAEPFARGAVDGLPRFRMVRDGVRGPSLASLMPLAYYKNTCIFIVAGVDVSCCRKAWPPELSGLAGSRQVKTPMQKHIERR